MQISHKFNRISVIKSISIMNQNNYIFQYLVGNYFLQKENYECGHQHPNVKTLVLYD